MYGAETWTLEKTDYKRLENFEMWSWGGVGDQLNRSCKKRRSITQSQKGSEYPTYNKTKKANWIGQILRRNSLLKHTIEGKLEGRIEVTERQVRRRKQLLDRIKETTGYWKLKAGALCGELALEQGRACSKTTELI